MVLLQDYLCIGLYKLGSIAFSRDRWEDVVSELILAADLDDLSHKSYQRGYARGDTQWVHIKQLSWFPSCSSVQAKS
jgi:hypothetical protein